jgi:dinuclear metal center YbgI/SA1388 family protein
MAPKVKDIQSWIHQIAPEDTAMEWDAVGLQIGDPDRIITRVLIALDLTQTVVTEAVTGGYEIVVLHHPFIFKPIAQIRLDMPVGKMLTALLTHGIAVLVAHTNLDLAPQGVSQILAERLDLMDIRPLTESGLGRMGNLAEPMRLVAFADGVAAKLDSPHLRILGEPDQMVTRVAVCGGSGGDLIPAMDICDLDVLVTGDIAYHDAMAAIEMGLSLIDAGHRETERPVLDHLATYLRQQLDAHGHEDVAVTVSSQGNTSIWMDNKG